MCKLILIGLGVLLFPKDAFAWGPVTHLSYGLEILDNLPMLVPVLQELLSKFRFDYLYGCMAADITLKKDGAGFEHNCHNWDVGIALLEATKTQKHKAFMYGYLSHLAADTISHNYFVPYQTVAAYKTNTLKHLYWELRLDTLHDASLWKLAKKIAKKFHSSSHDAFLETNLKKTLFTFRTNKILFNSTIHSLPSYRLLKPLLERSIWKLDNADIKEYRKLVITAMIDFLNKGKESKFYLIDPSGKLALEKAKRLKKALRKDHKDHRTEGVQQTIQLIKKDFKEALFNKPYHQKWVSHQ